MLSYDAHRGSRASPETNKFGVIRGQICRRYRRISERPENTRKWRLVSLGLHWENILQISMTFFLKRPPIFGHCEGTDIETASAPWNVHASHRQRYR